MGHIRTARSSWRLGLRPEFASGQFIHEVRLAQSRLHLRRSYATDAQPNKAAHKRVTVFNDTGRVNWGDLSGREKVARSTQQTFNFAFVAFGLVLVCGVGYVLFTDVFSPNSKTANWNRSVSRVKSSLECLDILGPANTIKAYGDSPWNSWARARQSGPTPISKVWTDPSTGRATIMMRFKVVGKKAEGWVTMHMEQGPQDRDFSYTLLALDVPGHQRVVLEGAKPGLKSAGGKGGNIFGVSFR